MNRLFGGMPAAWLTASRSGALASVSGDAGVAIGAFGHFNLRLVLRTRYHTPRNGA
jgi:hypothetical protein